LGGDYVFASPIAGMPTKLHNFSDLQVNHFNTSAGVKLAYWKAQPFRGLERSAKPNTRRLSGARSNPRGYRRGNEASSLTNSPGTVIHRSSLPLAARIQTMFCSSVK
jgi:hypothetical protein